MCVVFHIVTSSKSVRYQCAESACVEKKDDSPRLRHATRAGRHVIYVCGRAAIRTATAMFFGNQAWHNVQPLSQPDTNLPGDTYLGRVSTLSRAFRNYCGVPNLLAIKRTVHSGARTVVKPASTILQRAPTGSRECGALTHALKRRHAAHDAENTLYTSHATDTVGIMKKCALWNVERVQAPIRGRAVDASCNPTRTPCLEPSLDDQASTVKC